VLERDPTIAGVAVSATTRQQRPGEVDGREYVFLSDAEFQRRVDNGDFEEHVSFAGGRYGTLREQVDRLLAAGRNVILELEVDGSFAIRRRRPDACLVFIDASLDDLDERLHGRATEMAGEIEERLRIARAQREEREEFDHVILNDDRTRATDELYATMRSEISRRGAPSPPRDYH
jgi:guanylate kinase